MGTQVRGNFLASNASRLRDVILPLAGGVMDGGVMVVVVAADDDERLQEEWQSDNSATTLQKTFEFMVLSFLSPNKPVASPVIVKPFKFYLQVLTPQNALCCCIQIIVSWATTGTR